MAYCTEADIERELQMKITTTTELTTAEVADIIADTDAEIDSKLGDKYVVPITGSKALLVVKQISYLLCTGKIQDLYGFRGRKQADAETRETVPAKLMQGRRMLNDLVIGKTTLAFSTNGAALVVANQKVSSSYDDGIEAPDQVDFGTNFNKDRY